MYTKSLIFHMPFLYLVQRWVEGLSGLVDVKCLKLCLAHCNFSINVNCNCYYILMCLNQKQLEHGCSGLWIEQSIFSDIYLTSIIADFINHMCIQIDLEISNVNEYKHWCLKKFSVRDKIWGSFKWMVFVVFLKSRGWSEDVAQCQTTCLTWRMPGAGFIPQHHKKERKKNTVGWGTWYRSAVEHSPSMHKTLGLIHSTTIWDEKGKSL